MTHALWVTHRQTADNGGFHSSQPTSASSQSIRKGAYRGVHKAGVHRYGLFSLMVKTFCSGSSQAHCRDSTFYIHERSKKRWERKNEGKNDSGGKGKKIEKNDWAGRTHHPPFMLQRASSCYRKWSYQPWVVVVEGRGRGCINRPADQWRAVESYVCLRSVWGRALGFGGRLRVAGFPILPINTSLSCFWRWLNSKSFGAHLNLNIAIDFGCLRLFTSSSTHLEFATVHATNIFEKSLIWWRLLVITITDK